MAHRKLGMELFNRRENRSRALEAVSRAYEYRDRLSTRERYLAEAAYFDRIMVDNERARGAYQNMLELDPEDPWALNNLGVSYARSGDPAAAEEYYERASAADSAVGVFSFTNTVNAEVRQGKFDEATATIEAARRLYAGDWLAEQTWVMIPWARMEWDESERRLAEVREEWRSPFLRVMGAGHTGAIASARGRLEESARASAEGERINEERGLGGEALSAALAPAFVTLEVREDPARALRIMNEALARHPLANIPPEDRPYVRLARLTARAGRPDDSRAWSEESEVEVPEEARMRLDQQMLLAAADRALVEGRASEAIDLYRRGKRPGCATCEYRKMARAHLLLGQQDSTIALLTDLVEIPDVLRVFGDRTRLGPSYEQLAELHDGRGELGEAARYYALFVELWKDADEDLQPRVRAAQARLEEILREIG
jgi:tetratricopeptide (TPR) repeat protein